MTNLFLTASEVLQLLENSDITNYRYSTYIATRLATNGVKYWHLKMFMYVGILDIKTDGPYSEFRQPVVENYTPLEIGFMTAYEFQLLSRELKYIYTRDTTK